MRSGWIRLHRQIQECWIWDSSEEEPFNRATAWIDILLSCNHADKKIIFDGQPYIVKRGEWITSLVGLGNRWCWGRKKVSNFLNLLESDGMIEQERNNKRTLIRVLNYDVFQSCEDIQGTAGEQQKNTKGTAEEQQRNTNNNEKNDKNDKNKDKYMCAFEDFWKEYPRKVDKGNCYKQYQARLKSGFTEEELLTACKNYANECKKNRTEAKYIKHGATFLSATTPFVDYLKGDKDARGVSRLSVNDEISDEESRAIYNNDECPFDMP